MNATPRRFPDAYANTPRRVPLGRPLPPADEIASRAFGAYAQALAAFNADPTDEQANAVRDAYRDFLDSYATIAADTVDWLAERHGAEIARQQARRLARHPAAA